MRLCQCPHLCLNFSEFIMNPGVDNLLTTVLFVVALTLLHPAIVVNFKTSLCAGFTKLGWLSLAHQTWESWAYWINTLFARDRILGNNTNAFWRAQSEVRNCFCQVIVIAKLDLRLTVIFLRDTWLLVLWCVIGRIFVSRIKWFLLKYLFIITTWRRHWILMIVVWTHRLEILRMNWILSHEFIRLKWR
jgi:hypothetical protein